MLRRISLSFCAVCLFLSHNLFSDVQVVPQDLPDWSFAVYMEPCSSDLFPWLHNNMNMMALANTDNKKVNIVTQVHIEKDSSWRYEVAGGTIKPIGITQTYPNGGLDVVDLMAWTVKNRPAKHYGLIFWGHGFGILDPQYRPNSTDPFMWDVDPDESFHGCSGGFCPLKSLNFSTDTDKPCCMSSLLCGKAGEVYRGFMFNPNKTYITNAQMVQAFKTIHESVLGGKKLDVVGTDCCKMAMFEVAYQVRNYVGYWLGSQNCELIDGWNYKDFFTSFNGKSLEPVDVVKAITSAYHTYYAEHTSQNTYTLSAMDLSQLDPLVANFNAIMLLGKTLFDSAQTRADVAAMRAAIIDVRSKTPSMCQSPYYLDLGELYANLLEKLNASDTSKLNAAVVAQLKKLLQEGQELIKSAVVANVTGSARANLRGISIYFPRNRIDDSYVITPFAQETNWLPLLKNIVA